MACVFPRHRTKLKKNSVHKYDEVVLNQNVTQKFDQSKLIEAERKKITTFKQ